MFCNLKKQVTVPQEFHFAIDKRIPQPAAVVDLLDKVTQKGYIFFPFINIKTSFFLDFSYFFLLCCFHQLSIKSEPHYDKPLSRNTTPNPFHLHTEVSYFFFLLIEFSKIVIVLLFISFTFVSSGQRSREREKDSHGTHAETAGRGEGQDSKSVSISLYN